MLRSLLAKLVNMKKSTLVVVIIVSLVIIFSSLISFTESTNEVKKSVPKGDAAVINIWIDSYQRLDVLRNSSIKYLIIDVGGTTKDGKISTPEKEIDDFLKFIKNYEKEKNYHFILLPYSEINTYNYDITSKEFQKNYVKSYVDLNKKGFDGLLVDIEPIRLSQRGDFVNILSSLNGNLSKKSIIAVYSGSLANYGNTNEWEWDPGFFASVANKADIMIIPAYDTYLTTQKEYEDYILTQVWKITSRDWNTKFMLGIPTHKPFPEKSDIALAAYKNSIKYHLNPPFIGVAIFAEWTAEKQDWENLNNFNQKR